MVHDDITSTDSGEDRRAAPCGDTTPDNVSSQRVSHIFSSVMFEHNILESAEVVKFCSH